MNELYDRIWKIIDDQDREHGHSHNALLDGAIKQIAEEWHKDVVELKKAKWKLSLVENPRPEIKPLDPPPRYDEEYFEAMAKLDEMENR